MTQSLMLIALLLCISPRSASAFSPAAFHRPASRLSAGASQPEPFFVDLPRLLAITTGEGLPEPADPLAAELRCRKEQRELRERLPAVYVILFGGGDDEGVHSVEVPPGSKQNVVLGFESALDCNRFAVSLQAGGGSAAFVPTVEKLEMREVLGFAAGAKVQLLLVPEGTPLMPPDAYNEVQELDHLPKRDEGGGAQLGVGIADVAASLEKLFQESAEEGE